MKQKPSRIGCLQTCSEPHGGPWTQWRGFRGPVRCDAALIYHSASQRHAAGTAFARDAPAWLPSRIVHRHPESPP